MMNLRQILGLNLLVLTLLGCSFPDAGIWRTIAYTKIADSQADAGNMRGARESAALALESAWHLKSAETSDWARAAAVAARVHAGDVSGARALALRKDEGWRGNPELRLYLLILAQLERGDQAGARRSLELFRTGQATGDASNELRLSTLGLVELGDFAEALALIADNDDPKLRAELMLSIALKQARDGDVEAALQSLEEAREIREASETRWTTDLGEIDSIWQIARAIAGRGMRLYPPLLRDFLVDLDLHNDAYLPSHIAAAQARRGEDEAALEMIEQMTGTGGRAFVLAWVAVALAEDGDLAAGRGFADCALARLSDIEPGHEGVSTWVLYALARTGGTEPALAKAAEIFDRATRVTASGWTAIALGQGQVGDLSGMNESIARAGKDLENAIADEKPERAARYLTDTTADWAWIMAIGGDVPGAIAMAERISDPDRRAFALVPAVTALAETGNWDSATAVVKGMLGYWDKRHVAGRIDALRTHLSENDAKHDEPPPAPWYGRDALNLELLRTLSGASLAAPSDGGPPLGVDDLLSLAERTRDHGLRARLVAWAVELRAMAGEPEAAKAGIETALATARQEPDPYGRALALVEIAHARAILGAEDAALATLAEASELAPEISPEG